MSQFGNVPVEALADAVEKHVAKMDEADLAALLGAALGAMPDAAVLALVQSIFDAFRDRGESSEDAAEGADAPLNALEGGDRAAAAHLIAYARENTGVLKEAMAVFASGHHDQLHALPKPLIDGIAARL
jgi:kynureninase